MRSAVLLLCALVLAVGVAVVAQPPGGYDLIIRNGLILDGTGNPWVRGDVAISGDTITAIAPIVRGRGRQEIDARSLVISPGFIDLHTHARRGIFEGPDGGSPLPLGPFLDRLAALKTSPNIGMFVGQGSVREEVMGRVNRAASPDELAKMKEIVRQGMRDGAFGLSSGLFYVPGIFTPSDEVIALGLVAGEMGGIYISHMRNEAAGILDSVRETIAVGERGRLPSQITHHKIIGRPNWGRSVDTLRLVAEARARGVDVTIDQYPYTASSTSINVLLPPWALEGQQADVVARLGDAAQRSRIKAAIVESLKVDRGGGDPKNVAIASCGWDPSLAGRNLADITRAWGSEPTLENAAETTMTIVEKGGASAIFHAIDESDLERIMKDPATMVASDGEVPIFGKASPHPRSYGTFARVLGRYVRERKVLTLAEAVRKMTSMPAWRVGLHDRGVLRPGMKADIAVWDPDAITDKATFAEPHQYAEGVAVVIVNGAIAFVNGEMTPARPGRVLRGPAYVAPAQQDR